MQTKKQIIQRVKLGVENVFSINATAKAIQDNVPNEINIKYKKSIPNLKIILVYLISSLSIVLTVKIDRQKTQPINAKVTISVITIFFAISSLK